MTGSIFLATPIRMDEQKAKAIETWLESTMGVPVAQAADIYRQKRDMGWGGYIEYVASGVDFYTRKPIFCAICCVGQSLGKATGQIVEKSLAGSKPVFCIVDGPQQDPAISDHFAQRSIYQIHGFESVDTENWQSGWRLKLPLGHDLHSIVPGAKAFTSRSK